MASVQPLPSPSQPRSPRSPSYKALKPRDEHRQTSTSVPSSPIQNSCPPHTAYGTQTKKNMAASGTFFTDSPSVDNTPEHDEVEDPHDLSFSSNHVLRASMVDNLVMSLDQFSSGGFDDPTYTPRSNSYDTSTRLRKRGHTFSSSVSSEGDAHDLRNLPKPPETIPRIPVRNSVRYQKNVQRLPSIFGEDEDSVRSKVYDAQRAAQPGPARRKKNTSSGGKSNGSSNSSSIDLGHLASLSGRLGGAGNRRSRSFDFGTRQRVMRAPKPPGDAEGAPTPVIFAGPEAREGPAGITALPLVRKNSTKSSKSAYTKKGRSAALGTGTLRNDSVPQIPTMKSITSLNTAAHDHKSGLASPHEATPVSRPGFFRRVFGSSRNPTVHPETNSHHAHTKQQGRSTPVQDEPQPPSTPPGRGARAVRRTSTDASANKENQPVLTKKSSAFFRRRKKSFSSAVPPPLPLTLNAELKSEPEPVNGTSPVSSLRAFMDPYLAENLVPPSGHGRTNSMQGFYHTTLPPPTFAIPKESGNRSRGHARAESHGSNKTLKSNQKPPSTLRIPHQDSFLADSSSTGSTEESSRRSPFDAATPSDSDRSVTRARQSSKDLRLEPTTSYNSLPSPSSDPRNTALRQESWKSDKTSISAPPIPQPHSGSAVNPLDHGSKSSLNQKAPSLVPLQQGSKHSTFDSASDLSEYKSAPSTPLIIETPDDDRLGVTPSHILRPSMSQAQLRDANKRKAQQIFDNVDDEVDSSSAGPWLGEAGPDRENVRTVYMELFDWANQDILQSLRGLCDRVALKGETQQMDRVLDAFAKRWCECNPAHAFRSSDVVHTICYSILLLNTDLHLADIGQKMTKIQFVRNALPTVKQVAQVKDPDQTVRGLSIGSRMNVSGTDDSSNTTRTPKKSSDHSSYEDNPHSEPKHEMPTDAGPGRAWEMQMDSVLRSFYTSISQEPLPLFGSPIDPNVHLNAPNNFLTIGSNMLRRTPSVLSKAHSDTNRGRITGESKSLGARWISKTRSRPRLPSAPGFGSSRTSIDEQSSTWSPSMSSTWSKASLGKTLTSMSVDSLGTEATHNDYQSSIGFANALSQAIIRDDQLDFPIEEGAKAGILLEDESLELCGAPWAKEGIVKHKCHLEGVDKRSKDRNWNDCFAVIEKGWMRLFSFSMTAKSLRNKARTPKAGAVVGGGNWQENAEEVWKFMLRHTIASSLPPPGYSKARPYVWALSLPTGAVHLFSVGTPDIVKEFVHTANFWSARLSKEPMMGGISNMEYGWSDEVVSRALVSSESQPGVNGGHNPRPSTQMSMRSSMDHAGGVRAKLPGDRAHINEWNPPQQSMYASQLLEVDQLKALQAYVSNVEEELQKHNELRGMMLVAFSSKHPNSTKAMNNWEKKSSYLLREIVKFRTYIDTLQNAQATKERIYKIRKQEDEAQRAEMDSRGLNA